MEPKASADDALHVLQTLGQSWAESDHQGAQAEALMLGPLKRLPATCVGVRRTLEAPARTGAPAPTFEQAIAAVALTATDWCRRCRAAPALTTNVTADAVERLRGATRIASAGRSTPRRVLRHEFTSSEAGRTRRSTRIVMRATVRADRWYLDPVARCLSGGAFRTNVEPLEMRPATPTSSIRGSSPVQQLGHAGQAFQLTQDDRFAIEIARELDDSSRRTPTGLGVNWTCTMDVGSGS